MFYVPLVYVLADERVPAPGAVRERLLVRHGRRVPELAARLQHACSTSPRSERLTLETLVSHGATLPMNMMFVLVMAAWLFKSPSWAKRLLLPVIAVPVFVVYLVSDRRAAIVGLVAAVIMLCVVLFWTRRRAFWVVVPALVILGGAYIAAFWHNANSSLGGPAQAVKAVITAERGGPEGPVVGPLPTGRGRRHHRHHPLEPLFGVGFGQKFLRPYPLPAITTFLLAEYQHAQLDPVDLDEGRDRRLRRHDLPVRQDAATRGPGHPADGEDRYAGDDDRVGRLRARLRDLRLRRHRLGRPEHGAARSRGMAQIDSVVGLRSGRRGHRRHAGRVAEEPLDDVEAGAGPEPEPRARPVPNACRAPSPSAEHHHVHRAPGLRRHPHVQPRGPAPARARRAGEPDLPARRTSRWSSCPTARPTAPTSTSPTHRPRPRADRTSPRPTRARPRPATEAWSWPRATIVLFVDDDVVADPCLVEAAPREPRRRPTATPS